MNKDLHFDQVRSTVDQQQRTRSRLDQRSDAPNDGMTIEIHVHVIRERRNRCTGIRNGLQHRNTSWNKINMKLAFIPITIVRHIPHDCHHVNTCSCIALYHEAALKGAIVQCWRHTANHNKACYSGLKLPKSCARKHRWRYRMSERSDGVWNDICRRLLPQIRQLELGESGIFAQLEVLAVVHVHIFAVLASFPVM